MVRACRDLCREAGRPHSLPRLLSSETTPCPLEHLLLQCSQRVCPSRQELGVIMMVGSYVLKQPFMPLLPEWGGWLGAHFFGHFVIEEQHLVLVSQPSPL